MGTGMVRDAAFAPRCRIETPTSLIRTLDDVIPGLAGRDEPLLLDIAVARDTACEP
jgi:hypothetical protein